MWRRGGLRYGFRLVGNRPAALLAVMGDGPQANSSAQEGRDQVKLLSWVDLFIGDLAWLREHSSVPVFFLVVCTTSGILPEVGVDLS
mmetsp:Transcript_59235/g.157603  ORF Transcript_59235/g.157603 Transcript_59235/m.157603 type:complete len:87 (+) Transcript_59235:141-401(+)